MLSKAALVIFYAFFAFPAAAWSWSLEDLNDTVDQTNFIVDGRCSGTLVSLEYRLILTANHCVQHKVTSFKVKEVVDGALTEVEKVRYLDLPVTQKSYDGSRRVGSTEYMTEIVARAEAKDLALLQIRAKSIPYTVESKVVPANVELQRGEGVITVGNPNLLDASVGTGVIASMNRMFRVPWANNEEIAFLQHDSSTTGGSSGGAVYNESGYLIGVHVAGYRGVPLGFAVHPATIREFLDASCYPVYEGGVLKTEGDDWSCVKFGELDVEKAKPDVLAEGPSQFSADTKHEWWMHVMGLDGE